MHRNSWLVLLTAVVAGGFELAQAEELIVRVDADASVSPGTLREAASQAQKLFRRAGIKTVWLTCLAHDPGKWCTRSSSDRELVVNLIQRATADTPSSASAFAITDRRINAVFVFYDRISRSALARDHSCSLLLSIVMVHEVAHLLGLDHSGGIMRKSFGSEDLEKADRGFLRFDETQAAELRTAARDWMQRGESREEVAFLQ